MLDKIKRYLEKVNNKKFVNNLFIILLISIIFLIVVNIFMGGKSNEDVDKYVKDVNYDAEIDYSYYLEGKLMAILSELKGVNKVKVMVTVENSIEKITANNTTKTTENTIENDSEGGTREVHREDIVTQVVTKGGDGSLLVVKEIKPIIQGVIVVSDGAEDPEVKERIYDAVKTVLGIKGNKVQVYSSK